jgi:hypothetical protein
VIEKKNKKEIKKNQKTKNIRNRGEKKKTRVVKKLGLGGCEERIGSGEQEERTFLRGCCSFLVNPTR